MNLEHGLTWAEPDARQAIHFRPAHIDFIRFAHARAVSLAPPCHLRFANGDDLFGSIASLDSERLGFRTWFGGAMNISRAAVRSITFLSSNYSIVYEGPYDASGWTVANNASQSWSYHDGCFVGSGPGTLSRDLSLTNSATVEFDLDWNGPFQLLVGVYSDLQTRRDSYWLEFSSQQVSLRHAPAIGLPRNFGGVPLPGAGSKGKIRAAIQCNRQEGAVSVFVNNTMLKTWKDQGGFPAVQPGFVQALGTGLVFQQEGVAGATLKLGNFKVSQWQGPSEPDTTVETANTDSIHFINHDRAAGKITGIQNSKVTLALGDTVLNIPLERVTQINFAGAGAPSPAAGPWVVRAHFPGGGSLSFQLERWDDKMVCGQSPIFGSLSLQSAAIRQMEFNLDRPKGEGTAVADKEFDSLDE
jgi:hypothetical protein